MYRKVVKPANQYSGSSILLYGSGHRTQEQDQGGATEAHVSQGSKARQPAVLRIWDVFPDPGSGFFPSRIPDPNCLHPGSASKNLSILTPKKTKKMVSKL